MMVNHVGYPFYTSGETFGYTNLFLFVASIAKKSKACFQSKTDAVNPVFLVKNKEIVIR